MNTKKTILIALGIMSAGVIGYLYAGFWKRPQSRTTYRPQYYTPVPVGQINTPRARQPQPTQGPTPRAKQGQKPIKPRVSSRR